MKNRLKKLALLGAAALIFAGAHRTSAQAVTSVSAKAAVVMEAGTGRILFGQQELEHLPMASTTKIMTALLTLEQPDLDSYFTVDGTAILVEGTSMGLQAEDQVSLRALAYGMLLQSGNDAANAAAVRIGGTLSAFGDLMNQKAEALGLTNTHFVTPSGLDDPEHYSCARDMAELARNALQNPDFAEICGSSTARVEYGNPPYSRSMTNHNRLLREYEGAIGVKTGYTKKSGRCLVSAAQRDGITLICVTLSASDDWNVHKTLFNSWFDQLSWYSAESLLSLPQVPVTGGAAQSVKTEISSGQGLALTKEEFSRLTVQTVVSPMEYAPLAAGTEVGRAVFALDGEELLILPLTTKEEVPLHPENRHKSWWERVMEYFGKNKSQ